MRAMVVSPSILREQRRKLLQSQNSLPASTPYLTDRRIIGRPQSGQQGLDGPRMSRINRLQSCGRCSFGQFNNALQREADRLGRASRNGLVELAITFLHFQQRDQHRGFQISGTRKKSALNADKSSSVIGTTPLDRAGFMTVVSKLVRSFSGSWTD